MAVITTLVHNQITVINQQLGNLEWKKYSNPQCDRANIKK